MSGTAQFLPSVLVIVTAEGCLGCFLLFLEVLRLVHGERRETAMETSG